jgi:long-chain acyl-CoA synthetase
MNEIDYAQLATFGDLARYHARNRPDAIAFSFEGRTTSFAVFDRHTNQVAQALLREGIGKGERVAFLAKNSDHYFELMIGAAKMGAVTTPIGWRLAPAEIAHILADCEARLLFVGAELIDAARAAVREMQTPPRMIAMEPVEGLQAFEAWRDAAPSGDPDLQAQPSDVALQLYTSGTTGRPKGAMLTHDNLLAGRVLAGSAALGWNVWEPEDAAFVAMPVSHIGGTAWGMMALFHGSKAVIAREFDPGEALDTIEREAISKLFLVPAALQFMVRHPRAREIDVSALKMILYGASPMPLDLLRECMEVFRCEFCQQYGMTETCGAIVYLPPEDHDLNGNKRMRAAGLPFPGVELRIVDDAGKEVAPNVVGELLTRSKSNMPGYWHLPEATAATIDSAGWLRTGDAGYVDEDGYLYLYDRVKDLIISGGENIYPAEVENAVYGHPAIADVAVIGVPDERWGEAVKAMVVLKPGMSATEEEIIAFARDRIAHFKAPRSVTFIPAVPRNASGKALRRELREPFWAGRERRVN